MGLQCAVIRMRGKVKRLLLLFGRGIGCTLEQSISMGLRSFIYSLLCLCMFRLYLGQRLYLSHRRNKGRIERICHAQSLQLLLTMAFRFLTQCHTLLWGQRHHGLVEAVDRRVVLPVDVRIDVARQSLLFFFGGIACIFL